MNIAIIMAPRGFQDREFSVPYAYFTSKGYTVDVYSTKKGIAVGVFGKTFDVRHELSELDVNRYDAIVFIGGPGTPIVRADQLSEKIAVQANNSGKLIGAICWSPTILAKAGLLNGKKATVWYGEDNDFGMMTSKYLEEKGATYTGEDVTIDGNIITANGPSAAEAYAEALWKKLSEQ